jgi:threonine/homoserine/homoserine lactone efflux protein
MADVEQPRPPSILWYRWLGLSVLAAAILSFFTAALAELSSPGAPQNRPLFWTAVACNVSCFIVLPLLLLRAIRYRRLARKEWRAVLMRAVWGGPFGTLGALWDLSADPPASEGNAE